MIMSSKSTRMEDNSLLHCKFSEVVVLSTHYDPIAYALIITVGCSCVTAINKPSSFNLFNFVMYEYHETADKLMRYPKSTYCAMGFIILVNKTFLQGLHEYTFNTRLIMLNIPLECFFNVEGHVTLD